MFSKKRALVATAAATAIALLAGCSGGSSDTDSSTGSTSGGETVSGGTLTIATATPPTSLSAQNTGFGSESLYTQAVYDSLLRAEPDGTISPHLATEWSWSEDRLTLTMQLRDDVTFTDGEAFNADVAAQNVLRFRDGTSSNASWLSRVADAQATGEYELTITMSEPDPSLEWYLTMNAGMQESPAAFDSPDVETTPVGSGMYILNTGETVVGTTYVYDKNPDYWMPEEQHYDKLVLNLYADSSALINAIQGGQVNAGLIADTTTIPQAEAAGFTMVTNELDYQGLLLMDRDGTLAPELADVKVRQAINMAFDRPALVEAFVSGYGTPTTQIWPESSPSFDAALDDAYPYDPEAAKALLAEAGYPNGFTLSMPSTSAFPTQIFPLIQQQLADIGITVEYTDLAIGDFINDMIGAQYPAAFMQLQQDPTDWQIATFELTPEAIFNPFRVEDETVAELVDRIQQGDEAAGAELNTYVVEQAWFAPFYRMTTNFAVDGSTTAEAQTGNVYPYIWNIKPAA
ncbi:ABC transporter substrate-binding protein [Demequina sp. SYSU T00068]|uniref:ABC transporter substrate-binding protein n=1 Tax=Demequina lignilytica TaxID=3051663 RepID=UPI00262A1373|nr:ABC transporter substrate-binding protein [Demequina sp. SYSU T00068]MDN4491309.1 ABC transporter substrate-binding protein [Demequina sp. SYSU T00068]